MTDSETVAGWFDEKVVQDYQLIPQEEGEFNYQVVISRWNLHVIKNRLMLPYE